MKHHITLLTCPPMASARIATLILAGVLGPAALAGTQQRTVLPAGVACPFGLSFTATRSNGIHREFADKNSNVVRLLSASKGFDLTFTNVCPGSMLRSKPNGPVSRTTINPDGTQTVTITGHNVFILFPTDVPAGPSTIHYVGRLIYSVDPSTGVFTVKGSSGRQVNIRAVLAS